MPELAVPEVVGSVTGCEWVWMVVVPFSVQVVWNVVYDDCDEVEESVTGFTGVDEVLLALFVGTLELPVPEVLEDESVIGFTGDELVTLPLSVVLEVVPLP
jgi:hypothetical protein